MMIRIRLTAKMLALVPPETRRRFDENGIFDSAFDFHAEALYGTPMEFKALAEFFDRSARELDGVKGRGTDKRVMEFAVERIDEALARVAVPAPATVPVSITHDEQEALAALSNGAQLGVSLVARDRLLRRGLVVVDGTLTWRGRTVLAGRPPGDLVPLAFLKGSPRVKLVETVSRGAEQFDVGTVLRIEAIALDGSTVDLAGGPRNVGLRLFVVLPT